MQHSRRTSLPEIRPKVQTRTRSQPQPISVNSRLLSNTAYTRVQSLETKCLETNQIYEGSALQPGLAQPTRPRLPATKFAAPRRASWTAGAYSSDPLLETRSSSRDVCPQAAAVQKRIHTRGQLVRTLRVCASEFKQSKSHGQARVVTAKLTELREHTVHLVESLQSYHQAQGEPYTLESGENYACELAHDLSWLDELPITQWLGMWGRGNPFMLPRVVAGKPLMTKPAYVRNPPKGLTAGGATSYSSFVQPATMKNIKKALQYLRTQLARPKRVQEQAVVVNTSDHMEYAAVELQRCWRGSVARDMTVQKRMRADAAVELQRCWRGSMVRGNIAQLHQRADAAVELQRCWRGSVVRNDAVESRGRADAAVELQRCWRGSVVRGKSRKQCEEERMFEDAAVELQRCWRGRVARKGVRQQQQRVEAAIELKRQQAAAAVELQRCFRGNVVRGEIAYLHRRGEAVGQLQRCWRGGISRFKAALTAEEALSRAYRHFKNASTAAQTVICRELVLAARLGLQQQQRIKAAVELQRVWRGSDVRCKSSRNMLAARQLQRCWRGGISRFKAALTAEEALSRAYRHFKNASTAAQTVICRELVLAARLGLQQQQRIKAAVELQRDCAALDLQRVWRGKTIREELLEAGLLSQKRLEYFLQRLLGSPGASEFLPQVLERGISAADLSMLTPQELAGLGFPVVKTRRNSLHHD